MLWTKYGKDKLSTDGRWHLQHNHLARLGTWWVVYEHTRPEESRVEVARATSIYRGQATTLKEAKAHVEQLLKEEEEAKKDGLHTRPTP